MEHKTVFLDLEGTKRMIADLASTESGSFVVDGNLLTISCINTVFKIIECKRACSCGKKHSAHAVDGYTFQFSYDDGCFQNICDVVYVKKPVSCIKYVYETSLLKDEDIQDIVEKLRDVGESCGCRNELEIDNIFYNEVLIHITSGINPDDVESVKDDFISKFENWKRQNSEYNNELACAAKASHELLQNRILAIG